MKWMFLPFARISDYHGRSSPREFWMFQLLKVAFGIALSFWLFFVGALVSAPLLSGPQVGNLFSNLTALVALGVYLLCFLPAEIALTVRRWHDIGNSGWTILVIVVLGLIPIIRYLAGIINFVAMCWPGDKGSNQYGPSPLAG